MLKGIKDNYVPLTASVVIDHSQWNQIIVDAIEEVDLILQAKYQTSQLCIGHDMTNPNQLYLFLYSSNSNKYYVARYFRDFFEKYFLSAKLPIVGNTRIEESLWMPYEEHSIKYGLFSICDYSEKDIVSAYLAINKINREVFIDKSFDYDILLIRLFAIIYLTATHFERNSHFVTADEFLSLLYNDEVESFEPFYYAEKDLFLTIVEELDRNNTCEGMEWLKHWSVYLDSIVTANKKEFDSAVVKQKFYKIMSAILSTNRIPSIERISLVVAVSCALKDVSKLPASQYANI